ncbi:sugar-binding protein [Micrococcales bacterium 31B]|nr:sugar-binding protein [Micrococcales bacterium 31B]
MKNRIAKTGAALGVLTLLVGGVAACGSSSGSRTATSSAAGSSAAAGFDPKDSFIGIAMPERSSDNWIISGEKMKTDLEAKGYTVNLQYSDGTNGTQTQINNLQTMINNPKLKVLIVAAVDGEKLNQVLSDAASKGVKVIAYDRLINNTEAIDYYVTYDNKKVGELQGQSLLDGLEAQKPGGPWNVELFAGSPDDNNAKFFWDGAMSKLQPMIDSGKIVVPSKQTTFNQVATPGWSAETAQRRMTTLLGFYTSAQLDGVLAPNDKVSRGIQAAIGTTFPTFPVVTGQDAEADSVKLIMQGKQYSTIYKSAFDQAERTVMMVDSLAAGETPEVNDTTSYNNKIKNVDTYLLTPKVVTKENAAEVFANDEKLLAVVNGG